MKSCPKCAALFQEDSMICNVCDVKLVEVDLTQALELTRKKSFKEHIGSSDDRIPDSYKQYLIGGYLGDRSLFLMYDLSKNRLKHGKKPKRFLIQPIDFTAVFNIPWFFCNIINSNLFHLQYTSYCGRCNCKSIEGQHGLDECNYNIEYFGILDDILSGNILRTKEFYRQRTLENKKNGRKSAYADLFERKVRGEMFCDIISIGLSVFFWLYIAAYISYPWLKLLFQEIG